MVNRRVKVKTTGVRYADGWKYCSRCQLFVKGRIGRLCPFCHTRLRHSSRKKKNRTYIDPGELFSHS